MEVTAIIQRYYPEREDYIYPILDALAEQTNRPSLVVLWNNFETPFQQFSTPAFPIHVIHSSINTLMGRYAAALLSSTPAIFIQDDDLVCGPTIIERLTERLGDHSRTVFGISGSNINRASPNPYTDGTTVVEGRADIVLGRCFALTRRELISRLSRLHPSVGRCDDIVLSRQGPNYVLPIEPDITNLDEAGVGLRHDPQHSEERDAAVRQWWRLGV